MECYSKHLEKVAKEYEESDTINADPEKVTKQYADEQVCSWIHWCSGFLVQASYRLKSSFYQGFITDTEVKLIKHLIYFKWMSVKKII